MAPPATLGNLRHPTPRRGRPVPGRRRALAILLAAVTALATSPTAAAAGTDTAEAYVSPWGAADGAHVVSATPQGPRTLDLGIASPAMGGVVPVRVILPSGWSAGAERRFPTLYLLQGASDDYTSWTRETDVEELAEKANVIIVAPEGGRAGFYSDWWNGGRDGGPNWESFHTVELPQILERGYRANERRAVIGLSEGGLGALNYAARHQGAYAFAGSFSGIVDTADPALRKGIYLTLLREGLDPTLLWGRPEQHPRRWDAHNPSHDVSRLRGVKVHLSAAAGLSAPQDRTSDSAAGLLESPAYKPTLRFAHALRGTGVDVTAHLYLYGTHSWPYWERELHVAWPSVLTALQVQR